MGSQLTAHSGWPSKCWADTRAATAARARTDFMIMAGMGYDGAGCTAADRLKRVDVSRRIYNQTYDQLESWTKRSRRTMYGWQAGGIYLSRISATICLLHTGQPCHPGSPWLSTTFQKCCRAPTRHPLPTDNRRALPATQGCPIARAVSLPSCLGGSTGIALSWLARAHLVIKRYFYTRQAGCPVSARCSSVPAGRDPVASAHMPICFVLPSLSRNPKRRQH